MMITRPEPTVFARMSTDRHPYDRRTWRGAPSMPVLLERDAALARSEPALFSDGASPRPGRAADALQPLWMFFADDEPADEELEPDFDEEDLEDDADLDDEEDEDEDLFEDDDEEDEDIFEDEDEDDEDVFDDDDEEEDDDEEL